MSLKKFRLSSLLDKHGEIEGAVEKLELQDEKVEKIIKKKSKKN